MTSAEDCLEQMRNIYKQFTGEEISLAIKIIRAEMTAEADRTELQQEILAKQKKLEEIK